MNWKNKYKDLATERSIQIILLAIIGIVGTYMLKIKFINHKLIYFIYGVTIITQILNDNAIKYELKKRCK